MYSLYFLYVKIRFFSDAKGCLTHGPYQQSVPSTGPEVLQNCARRRVPAEPLSAAALRPIHARHLAAALRIPVESRQPCGSSSYQLLSSAKRDELQRSSRPADETYP